MLRPHPYKRPLLRLARETYYAGGAGPAAAYSEGLYVAVACNDYPQPYDMTAPRRTRQAQYQRSIQRLAPQPAAAVRARSRVREWVSSPYGYYDDCLRWPAPSRWVHPVPPDADLPRRADAGARR